MMRHAVRFMRVLAGGFALAVLGSMATGCASLEAKLASYDAAMAEKSLAADQARICFARKSSLVGAAVSHYVVDCGSHIEFDTKIIERGQITFGDAITTGVEKVTVTKSGVDVKSETIDLRRSGLRTVTVTETQQVMAPNSGRMCYVQFLVLPKSVAETELAAGENGALGVLRKEGDTLVPLYIVSLVGPDKTPFVSTGAVAADATDRIRPNARYAGSVRSGGSIVFDRPAGTMRLRVITLGGDEAFAPDFQVEAGKKYLVDYTYSFSGTTFTLSERP